MFRMSMCAAYRVVLWVGDEGAVVGYVRRLRYHGVVGFGCPTVDACFAWCESMFTHSCLAADVCPLVHFAGSVAM